MVIESIRVKNYKSWKDSLEVHLSRGLNIVVGKNNSGKTAFLEAISLRAENVPHLTLRSIEFQHSHIQPRERTSREKFYRNMVWVVDGTRLKRDYQRFLRHKDHFHLVKDGIFKVDDSEECFHPSWTGS